MVLEFCVQYKWIISILSISLLGSFFFAYYYYFPQRELSEGVAAPTVLLLKSESEPALPPENWIFNPYTQVYEFDKKPALWLYWDNAKNQQMPPHICLALESLHCHNHQSFTIRIVNSDLIYKYLQRVHPIFYSLDLNHRSDYFRGRILEVFGGVYMDIDVIATHSLTLWSKYLPEYDIIGYNWSPDEIGITSLGPARANHTLFRLFTLGIHQKMDEKLDLELKEKRDLFSWPGVSRDVIVPIFHELLQKNLTKSLIFNGPTTVGQLTGNAPSMLDNDEHCKVLETLDMKVPYLMYHNSVLKHFNGTDQDLLKSKTKLGCVYREAMKNCSRELSCEELQRLYTK